MVEDANTTSESLFRSAKRRKVFRKRTTDEDAPEDPLDATANEPRSHILQNESSAEHQPVVRRPAAKKHGIGFSSGSTTGQMTDQTDMQMALVPVVKQDEAEVIPIDRFMKPTGKVVVEDKHLTAYVDSKLAELRSSTSTPTSNDEATLVDGSQRSNFSSSSSDPRTTTGMTETTDVATLHGTSNAQRRAQARADRTPQKQRRRQPQIDPSATARNAMVDRIMQESQVPMYDQPSAASTGIDSDEAAAEAFKAEFLAGLEEQNRRKPPGPPPAGRGAQNAAPPTGPKLGGSRSQREKMKAIEEAKGKK
ncbi:hypothetical protein DOTSEDRAFT_89573 [Dothistroma septosporum NZE10]|uniref:Uncharacterized protein n=1 Tax=Dothistroma septosporum (strain NZE10 / CBS 128990) TaxID=675120 RepID=N1PKJ6_DOTSN|nr:hypothetical protein DOTSEDRAFT_89573 [Dothistroma septosporum NZE10]